MKTATPLRLLLPALLGGCTLIPHYDRPALPVAATYPVGTTASAIPSAETIGWRSFFTDPRLQALIEIALRNNRDLRIAMLNVAEAQGNYQVQRGELFPSIGLGGSGQFGSLPESSSIPTSTTGLSGAPTSGSAPGSAAPTTVEGTPSTHAAYRYYNASVGFTAYELDVFGRLRSLSRQSFEQYLGYAETARSSQISLVAEIASGYLAVAADQALLKVTQDTVSSDTTADDIANAQMNGGTGTLLSVRQSETALQTARANLAEYKRQLAQDQDALVLLVGAPLPDDLPRGDGLDQPGLLADIPAGLPSDLLLRRPDILAAEHNLLAANANIGAARAAFFPSISLTGSGGVAGSHLSRLFTGGALTWSFEPQINIPIFTGGQNLGNLRVAKAEKNIQVARYEQAIQTAFREVSDGLAARTTYADQVAAQQLLVDAAADSLRLALMRFQAGVDNYLPVLTAQQALYAGQQTLLGLQQARLASLVTLYKSLGGGWKER